MTRGLKNNNPGNIRRSAVQYLGEVPSTDPDFKQFRGVAYGYRAMMMLIKTYQVRYGLNTIRGVIHRYAPPVENSTSSYVQTVSSRTGIPADRKFSWSDRDTVVAIVAAMSYVENGVAAVMGDVEVGADLFYGGR